MDRTTSPTPTPTPRATGGYSCRPWRIFTADERLVCPSGHRLDDPLVWSYGGFRCTHKGANGRSDCGRVVLVLAGGMRDLQNRPVSVLIEVTPAELRHMKAERMDVAAMLAFLALPLERDVGVATPAGA